MGSKEGLALSYRCLNLKVKKVQFLHDSVPADSLHQAAAVGKHGIQGLGGDGRVQSCPFHLNRTASLGLNKRHGCYGNRFLTTKR